MSSQKNIETVEAIFKSYELLDERLDKKAALFETEKITNFTGMFNGVMASSKKKMIESASSKFEQVQADKKAKVGKEEKSENELIVDIPTIATNANRATISLGIVDELLIRIIVYLYIYYNRQKFLMLCIFLRFLLSDS
ncbi:unnamed protein product [Caenorhabditis bovis]|uniref:Uncharacterized protein n=1 Tax=Caenorhabditis bovis TaxID=2654633 RepID=A0A8S1ELF0_9PELO|nr:unnamed protein product [Caenorhabditis bovis]